ncbi:hypothetical protein [Sphingomonas sp. ACRSK]|uniref:hypothetical protein n=1 Tax=Sphingomonas sp. ACRSK TaxID=2918213 RepID=UPI001EF68F83|nr:hypothetical protein [Sphingomonas sp. ACRSK]MCG7348833.1 hypothetical protein [Sphingomonas sp. ACRSK]
MNLLDLMRSVTEIEYWPAAYAMLLLGIGADKHHGDYYGMGVKTEAENAELITAWKNWDRFDRMDHVATTIANEANSYAEVEAA